MSQDLAQIWAQLSPELTRYFRRYLPNASDAEDFTSEAFLRIVSKDGIETPERMIWVVAKHLLIDEYRDKARTSEDFEARVWPGVKERTAVLAMSLRNGDDEMFASAIIRAEDENHLVSGFVPSVEDQFFATQHDEVVRALEIELRDAYILGELRGLPSREAAPLLGVSHMTANSRRELATTSIREELSA